MSHDFKYRCCLINCFPYNLKFIWDNALHDRIEPYQNQMLLQQCMPQKSKISSFYSLLEKVVLAKFGKYKKSKPIEFML